MGDSVVVQMNNMIKVGIRPPNIFSSFASQSGGYEKIGFRKKDMYNKINEQRRKICSDVKGAVQFLGELRLIDTMMYFEHTVDAEGRLQHLFWSDGMSQLDYKLYGEVLAFDATYGKNKYFMPLVVFCGVNNHNRSTIFAAAIIANETEETYVWLLEQFSRAMKEFTKAFEDCMLRYYDIATFRRKWNEIITKFGLEENTWVISLFEKRTMWVTTYLRGKFFGGFRTTSRCEGLHSELSKFVSSRYNLSDFLQHFYRCLGHMRFKEKEDDFTSIHGDPSRGLPCEHIIAVLDHLGIDEIPDSLVLKRWTKGAKDGLYGEDGERYETWDAARSARRGALNGWYDQVSCFHVETIQKFNVERDRILADLKECRAKKAAQEERCGFSGNVTSDTLRNPIRAATKGSDVATSSGIRVRRKQNCYICKLPGHNKLTCPRGAQQYQPRQQSGGAGTSNNVEHDDVLHDYEEFDPDNWTF
ncbi:MULE transposase domain [Sesbania bispinosa]|nr:MULE transposase domain [Sesbania bispinosa]